MPRYKVIAAGFFNGKSYKPGGKRDTIYMDKPFPKGKVPSWVEPMKAETPAEKKKRLVAEKKNKEAADKKKKEDTKEIEEASFMGTGEASGSKVETL